MSYSTTESVDDCPFFAFGLSNGHDQRNMLTNSSVMIVTQLCMIRFLASRASSQHELFSQRTTSKPLTFSITSLPPLSNSALAWLYGSFMYYVRPYPFSSHGD